MNRAEARLLREATKEVAHHNEHLWWELKREIFDRGLQDYYWRQSEFEIPAGRAVSRLPENVLRELHMAYRAQHASHADTSRSRMIEHYATLMIAEIVRRAGVAAYRTDNW